MRRFEYSRYAWTESHDRILTIEEAKTRLNELGRSGWQLVHMATTQNNTVLTHVAWFMRELNE